MLLNLKDSLTLLFEDQGKFSGKLICETDEDSILSVDPRSMSNLDGSSTVSSKSGSDRGDHPLDLRKRLDRSTDAVIARLKWIKAMRELATKYGLDGLVRQVMILALSSSERYEELIAYQDHDMVKEFVKKLDAAGRIPSGVKKADLEKSLILKGKITIQEIINIDHEFHKSVVGPVNERRELFNNIIDSNPKMADIFNTDVHRDINLEYRDTLAPRDAKPVKVIIKSTTPLAKQLQEFTAALHRTDKDLANELIKKFSSVYQSLISEMSERPEMAGPDHEAQRVYTATLYALHKVAPLLNVTRQDEVAAKDREAKQGEVDKLKKHKDAEERKRVEKETAEASLKKQAETNYWADVKLAIAKAPKEKVDRVKEAVDKFFESGSIKPKTLVEQLRWFDASPSSNHKLWGDYIRRHLGIRSHKEYEDAMATARAATAPVDPSTATSPGTETNSIPMMITRQMEQQLTTMGYTQEQINKMTPQQAHDSINKAKPVSGPARSSTQPVQSPQPPGTEPQGADVSDDEFDEFLDHISKEAGIDDTESPPVT